MEKHIPLRTCVSCRSRKAKSTMLRVVKTSDGKIVFDKSGKIEGRGAYLCKSDECLKKLVKSKAFNRSYKQMVDESVYNELSEYLKAELMAELPQEK